MTKVGAAAPGELPGELLSYPEQTLNGHVVDYYGYCLVNMAIFWRKVAVSECC